MERSWYRHKGLGLFVPPAPISLTLMATDRISRFCLDDCLQASAEAGQHNFLVKVVKVLRSSQFRVEYRSEFGDRSGGGSRDPGLCDAAHGEPRARSRGDREAGLSLSVLGDRTHHVAMGLAGCADGVSAGGCAGQTCARGLPTVAIPAFWRCAVQSGMLDYRSFETCSPIDMLKSVLAHDPRPVVAALYLKEIYSSHERGALDELAADYGRLTVQTGGIVDMLQFCDFIVTEKPALRSTAFLANSPCFLRQSIFTISGCLSPSAASKTRLSAREIIRPIMRAFSFGFGK